MELRFTLAVVTGGGTLLGRELCLGLARAGAAVLVADRGPRAARETAALVRASRVAAWAMDVDVHDETDLRLLAARARDLGGADLLVNAGGCPGVAGQHLVEQAADEGDAGGGPGGAGGGAAGGAAGGGASRGAGGSRTLEADVRASMLLTRLLLEDADVRRGQREGTVAVVNVVSSAVRGPGGGASPEYAAATAALLRFTGALADPATAARARVMAVVTGPIGADDAEPSRGDPPPLRPAEVTRVVLDLLARGEAGRVVELAEPGAL